MAKTSFTKAITCKICNSLLTLATQHPQNNFVIKVKSDYMCLQQPPMSAACCKKFSSVKILQPVFSEILVKNLTVTTLAPFVSTTTVQKNEKKYCIACTGKINAGPHGVPFVIKTISITPKVRLHCNKTRSFRPIAILITNQTKPSIDLTCFDCLRETETALDSLAGNLTQLSSTGSKLIEMECQQIKSNENEITTHLNGSFAVPFTMTNKAKVISN